MNGLKQKIDALSNKFNLGKNPETLKQILKVLYDLENENDVTHIERLVLLINQCIVLDALNIDNAEINDKHFNRSSILAQIVTYYEEFVSCAIVDKLENDSSIAFKEQISYVIALLLYKVHDYMTAYFYFKESKKFSGILKYRENSNGLNAIGRIKRDIHLAYCCEYIGTPEMNCDKLVESLQLLLGADSKTRSAVEYWQNLKNHGYSNMDEIESNLAGNESIEEKVLNIIEILIGYYNDKESVFSMLMKMRHNGEDVSSEYNEAVHVLAHCLNELNMFLSNYNLVNVCNQSGEQALENLKKKNLIKMIARICIDSLGEQYGTCQATIRAEQGNGIDAIFRMHSLDTRSLSACDIAELDFYQYYFESMFHYDSYEEEHEHGKEFYNFCKNNYSSNPDNYQDGLLHYYIVLLRNELKNFLEEIIRRTDRNELFFEKDRKIRFSKCFEAYEELRTHEFSSYVTAQVFFEREKLIIIYKILRNLQDNRIPLFYDSRNFEKKLTVTEQVEELYNLCKKFNEHSKYNRISFDVLSMSWYDEISKKSIYDKNNCTKVYEKSKNPVVQEGIPIWVDGLVFEFYGNIKKFEEYLVKCSVFNYKFLCADDYIKNKLVLENKILYFDDVDECYNCCSRLYNSMKSGGEYRIFYVGEYDDDFSFGKIASFGSIDICFLMAYIYGSIEKILDYVFNPKPIYILAPLRNVSNFVFQEAEFDSLLCFPHNYTHAIEVNSGGIGIEYQKELQEEECFDVIFQNDDIRNACICIVKLYEDKLYVLREGKLVRKNVHVGLVNNMYDDYAKARKLTENKRHTRCVDESNNLAKCDFFYQRISDDEKFSRKDQKAAMKLLYLLHIACEEQVSSIYNCYLLQTSFMRTRRCEGNGFQICIFNKNITEFIAGQLCFRDVVTVTKIYHDTEKKEISFASEFSNTPVEVEESFIDEQRRTLARLENLLGECEEIIFRYQNHGYETSLDIVKKIKLDAQTLKNKAVKGKRKDFSYVNSRYAMLKEKLESVVF